MPIIRFDHYNLRAARAVLDKLRDFYVNIVGLAEGPRPLTSSFGYWLYADDAAVLHLSETKADEVRASHVRGTFDHVAFSCARLDAMRVHLDNHGIDYRSSGVPATGQIQLFFTDPAGNGVELNFAREAIAG